MAERTYRRITQLSGASYSNTTRPLASSVAAGTPIWNTDDGAVNWSDGTVWRNAAGDPTGA